MSAVTWQEEAAERDDPATIPLLSDCSIPQLGDLVRVGKGSRTWRIESFHSGTGLDGRITTYARLERSDDPSTRMSAECHRLVLVEGASQ